MNTKQKMTGFTLLEMMIVVAIIGIVGAIAMPSYTKYVKRAKASEVITLYENMKIHMVAYHLDNGKWPTNYGNLSQRNEDIGLGPTDSYSTNTIDRAWVGSNGVRGKGTKGSGHIAITYKDGSLRASPNNRGGRFIATVERVNGRYKWVCNNTSSSAVWKSDMSHEYLPESCHN